MFSIEIIKVIIESKPFVCDQSNFSSFLFFFVVFILFFFGGGGEHPVYFIYDYPKK